VRLEYRIDEGRQVAEVTIADTGMGIPAAEMPNVFNEFFRASNARRSQIMGTGIGLSTVRTLVERYHGAIDLDSEEGKGTTVRVVLPLAPDQTPPGSPGDEI